MKVLGASKIPALILHQIPKAVKIL